MPRLVPVIVLVAATLIGLLYWQQSRPQPLVVSGFIEADEIRVGSRVGGRIAEVAAAEGQRVKAGDRLLRIEPFDLQERLATARAESAAAQAEHARLKAGFRPEEIEQARAKRARAAAVLEKLRAGPRKQEIAIARERLKAAQAGLALAQAEHDRVMRLQRETAAAQIEIERIQRALKSAQAESASAEQELALLEEGTRKEDIAEAAAMLAEAEAAQKLAETGSRAEDIARAAAQQAGAEASVAAIEKQLRELDVASPCDCIVEAIDLRPGDLVAPNAPAVTLLDLSRLWVRAYVPESRLGQLKLDQRVPLVVDGFPGRTFHGHITFIASEGEFTPRNVQTPEERSKQVFRVKITLDDGADELRVGMSADVRLAEAAAP